MDASESEGLGLSVLLYMGAITGALAVIAVPVYFATQPDVYKNPPLARSDSVLSGPIVGRSESTPFPLARLQQQIIIDPAIVAALNAKFTSNGNAIANSSVKARKIETERYAAPRIARRPAETPVAAAEIQSERRRPVFSLFSLFGG